MHVVLIFVLLFMVRRTLLFAVLEKSYRGELVVPDRRFPATYVVHGVHRPDCDVAPDVVGSDTPSIRLIDI